MIRTDEIKFKLLRNGIEFGEIFAGESDPTLMMNSDGEIKTSLQGSFLDYAIDKKGNKAEPDWLIDEIQPVLITNGVEHKLGVLAPASVTPMDDGTTKTVEIQAYDRCWRVRDTKAEGFIYLEAGTRYTTAIKRLLTACGIPTVLMTESDVVLTDDREDWETGTSYLTIINTLLSEINYEQLFFDEDGNAVARPVSIPTAESIKHVFTDRVPDVQIPKEAEMIRILPEVQILTDIYSAPNVIICICSNPDKSGAMIATAQNSNPMSPLSIVRRKRRIVKVIRVQNIASQIELESYALKALHDSMFSGETISVSTELLTGFGVNDVSAIRYGDDFFGICIESQWTMQLGINGKMTHTMKRMVVNLD